MLIYIRQSDGKLIAEDHHPKLRRSISLCLGAESDDAEVIALAVLIDYFSSELNGTAKALLFHQEFAKRVIQHLGGCWILSDSQINNALAEILAERVLSADRFSSGVTLIGGHRRRDVLLDDFTIELE